VAKNRLPADEPLHEINISPLIDMVFILLIFFIVTTVFVEEPGVTVDRPPAVTAADLQKNSILVAITPTGNVVYGGRDVGIAGIRTVVRRLTQRESLPVILQVDELAPASVVVRVVDEAKLGGARNIFVSTEK
jgi:biopolymer transport protein ExbD